MSSLRSAAESTSAETSVQHPHTIAALLESRADAYGDKPLIDCLGVVRTYRQMRNAVQATAEALRTAGVQAGDRVAVMADNRIEVLEYLLGCAWLGAIAVPLNTSLRGEMLRHQLADSEPVRIVVDSNSVDALTSPADVVVPPLWCLPSADARVPAAATAAPQITTGSLPPTDVSPADTAMILYTSGTTGPAKGVECPQAQFFWWGTVVGAQLGLTEDDVLYTCLPLFHVNALGAFFQALLSGATIVVGPRFSASRMMERLAQSQATVTYLLGTMVTMILTKPATSFDRAHRVTRALAPGATEDVFTQFGSRFGIELLDGYGSTETNGVIGTTSGEQRPGWMGTCRHGFDAQVVDALDAPVPDGTPGELVLRAAEPFAFATGYFRNPAKSLQARRNLWFHTGDRVIRSADGWFRFVERISDSIRRRGENISSYDVEFAVRSHPLVQDAAAYAIPAAVGEDDVAVAVVITPGAQLAEPEIVDWCQGRLTSFAIPRYIGIVEQLPLTPQGKVRRQALREAGAAQLWDRDAAGVPGGHPDDRRAR